MLASDGPRVRAAPGARTRLARRAPGASARGFAVPLLRGAEVAQPARVPRLPAHADRARAGRSPAPACAWPRATRARTRRTGTRAKSSCGSSGRRWRRRSRSQSSPSRSRGGAVAVWRRPLVALYLFVVGLAAHNIVMALLWGAGVRGASLELISAWKEILLAVAVASVALRPLRARRLPFRPGLDRRARARLRRARARLRRDPAERARRKRGPQRRAARDPPRPRPRRRVLPRPLGRRDRRRRSARSPGRSSAPARPSPASAWSRSTRSSVGWWHRSGAVGYFRHQLGFDYHGPGGMPENFAFNTGNNHLFRRLISTFISPLAAAYMLVVSLLVAPLRRLALPLAALVFAGLVFTISRSALTGLVAGLVVLAIARRRALAARRRGRRDRRRHRLRPRVHARRADDSLPPGGAEGAGAERPPASRCEEPALQLQRAVLAEPPVQPPPRARDGRPPPAGLRARERGSDGGALRRRAEGGRVELHRDRCRDRPRRDDPRSSPGTWRCSPGSSAAPGRSRPATSATAPPGSPPRSPPCS